MTQLRAAFAVTSAASETMGLNAQELITTDMAMTESTLFGRWKQRTQGATVEYNLFNTRGVEDGSDDEKSGLRNRGAGVREREV